MSQQIVINFARAKNNPLHFVGGSSVGGPENFFESTMDEFFRWRRREFCAQQAFRCHNDKRFDEVALHLTPQHMEILSGSGEIADLNVVLGAGLEKALQPRAGVFSALAFVAMGQ